MISFLQQRFMMGVEAVYSSYNNLILASIVRINGHMILLHLNWLLENLIRVRYLLILPKLEMQRQKDLRLLGHLLARIQQLKILMQIS